MKWSAPETEAGYTTVYIERATTQGGSYSALANQTSSDTTYFDSTGTPTSWYRIRFYDGTNYSSYSPPMRGNSSLGYVTISEVRAVLKLQPAEYSDDEIQIFINKGTKKVDESTSRTWQGFSTAQNMLLDGSNSNILYLQDTDIVEILSLDVDVSNSGTFTSVTPYYVTLYEEGKIVLDPTRNSGLEVKTFSKGFKNVRISYSFGNPVPTEEVKELCLLYIAQFIKQDPTRAEQIKMIENDLRFKRPNLV